MSSKKSTVLTDTDCLSVNLFYSNGIDLVGRRITDILRN